MQAKMLGSIQKEDYSDVNQIIIRPSLNLMASHLSWIYPTTRGDDLISLVCKVIYRQIV